MALPILIWVGVRSSSNRLCNHDIFREAVPLPAIML
jgi:hypothetical protein